MNILQIRWYRGRNQLQRSLLTENKKTNLEVGCGAMIIHTVPHYTKT